MSKGARNMEVMGLVVGLVVLFILVKFMGLAMSLFFNGVLGAIGLYVYNMIAGAVGLNKVEITIIPALIVGFFGIPGLIAVILWTIVVK